MATLLLAIVVAYALIAVAVLIIIYIIVAFVVATVMAVFAVIVAALAASVVGAPKIPAVMAKASAFAAKSKSILATSNTAIEGVEAGFAIGIGAVMAGGIIGQALLGNTDAVADLKQATIDSIEDVAKDTLDELISKLKGKYVDDVFAGEDEWTQEAGESVGDLIMDQIPSPSDAFEDDEQQQTTT